MYQSTGEPVTYTNWIPNHLDNFVSHHDEDCIALIPYKNGIWDDIPCGDSLLGFDLGETHLSFCEYGRLYYLLFMIYTFRFYRSILPYYSKVCLIFMNVACDFRRIVKSLHVNVIKTSVPHLCWKRIDWTKTYFKTLNLESACNPRYGLHGRDIQSDWPVFGHRQNCIKCYQSKIKVFKITSVASAVITILKLHW